MSKNLPENYDPIEILKEAIHFPRFEDRYNTLFSLYGDSIHDIDKPKEEQKFYPELKKFIHDMFIEDYYNIIDVDIMNRIQKRNILRTCASCGTRYMPDPMDYYNSTHGEKVKFLCPSCKKSM